MILGDNMKDKRHLKLLNYASKERKECSVSKIEVEKYVNNYSDRGYIDVFEYNDVNNWCTITEVKPEIDDVGDLIRQFSKYARNVSYKINVLYLYVFNKDNIYQELYEFVKLYKLSNLKKYNLCIHIVEEITLKYHSSIYLNKDEE